MKRIALADTRLWMDGDYTGNTAADAAATVPSAKSATYYTRRPIPVIRHALVWQAVRH